ncbi:MAG TPA: DUF1028 domain-containing protein [Solirubrobacteraceae bacterium]|nr:DUF1028 domain-containing protein [Solirubrobacteraceae bacterium]
MTYSIVARDPETGELGVAVQSHWFSVGSVVPWARPGVGAVATQATAEPAYGPRALALMEQGVSAPDALQRLLAADPQRAHRQVALVDSDGRVAAHTGEQCMTFAGDIQSAGVSCQGNIMVSNAVWPAMLDAFAVAEGPLTRRLLAALEAAERAGGDLRGRQSAAILVVPAGGEAWATVTSLRVEDHAEPLAELARLVRLQEAYGLASAGDDRIAEGRHGEAAELFARACELAPESAELRFWAGLGAAQTGDIEAALSWIQPALDAHGGWSELLRRLPPELAPGAPALRARLAAPD